MKDTDTNEATARSIRALFDLPRYMLVSIARWAGWGQRLLSRAGVVPAQDCGAGLVGEVRLSAL